MQPGEREGLLEERLCVGDYYDEGQRVTGEWFGSGVEYLGLAGEVRADDFLRLCDNQHPGTGETLTQRQTGRRVERDGTVANWRIFFDFTFSPPKSISIGVSLGADERILDLHKCAVCLVLKEFEAFAATPIRTGRTQDDRFTGNSWRRCLRTIHPARLILICKCWAPYSTPRSIRSRSAGRHSRLSGC